MEKERKTLRSRSPEDAARIWDRFAPRSKNGKGTPPPTTRQPDGARTMANGRVVPPANLIRGKR